MENPPHSTITVEQSKYFMNMCIMQVKTKSNIVFYDEQIDVKVLFLNKDSGNLQNAAFEIKNIIIQDEAGQQFEPQTTKKKDVKTHSFHLIPETNYFVNGTAAFSICLNRYFKPVGTKIRILIRTSIENFQVQALSDELLLCRGSLVLLNNVPEKWYKDEGGKSNCIPLHLKLHSKDMSRFGGIDNIPLCATLLYEDESLVPIADILHPCEGMVMPLSSFAGFKINFKVAHCSQSHQGKQFRIKISPNTKLMPELSDIASVLSKPFQVKSKRRRKASPRNKRPELSFTSARQPFFKKPKMETQIAKQPILAPKSKVIATSPQSKCASELKLILDWVGSTLNTLETLQWEHVGFSINSKGEADKSLPIYRCPSCKKYKEQIMGQPGMHTLSCQIANNLKDYTKTVRPLFLNLANKIEKLEGQNPFPEESQITGNNAPPTPWASLEKAISVDEAGKTPELTSVSTQNEHPQQIHDDKPNSPPKPSSIGRNISDMILQSPAFHRHVSDVIMGMLPIIQEPRSLTENKVHYIIAEDFKAADLRMPGTSCYGNPAFDCNSQLLGFYVSHFSGTLGSPIIKFYDSTQWAILDAGMIESLKTQLQNKLSNQNSQNNLKSRKEIVFDVADFDMDLKKMKQTCFRDIAENLTFQDFTDDDMLDLYSAFSKSEDNFDPDDNDGICDSMFA